MSHWILVFVGAFILDAVWARYNIATAQLRVGASGLYAGLIYILNGGIVIGFVMNWRLLIPATIGAMLGTILSVWLHKRGW
jgi:hypothetical protein